jgi:hypothetical protein
MSYNVENDSRYCYFMATGGESERTIYSLQSGGDDCMDGIERGDEAEGVRIALRA